MLDKNITKEEQEIIDSARLFMYEMFKKEGSLKSFLNNKEFFSVKKTINYFYGWIARSWENRIFYKFY